MTTVNSIEDLVRILDEHPEWLEALRARLLTRELLELPQTVAQLVDTVSGLSQRVEALEQGQTRLEESHARLAESMVRLEESHAQLAASQARMQESQARMQESQARMQESQARLETRQDRMQDDLGWLKGRIIYDIVRNDAGLIAREMGFELVKTLARADLMELTRQHDVSDLPRGTMQSFYRADLVMQVADAVGTQHYIAVEASFTVNGRDSRRAIRNAELMTRLTGQPAMGAVAGVRLDRDLSDQTEFDQLHWYEIPSEDLEAE